MEIVGYLGFIGFLEILRFILDSWDLFGIHYFGFIDIMGLILNLQILWIYDWDLFWNLGNY